MFRHYALGLLHTRLGDSDADLAEYEILTTLNKKLAISCMNESMNNLRDSEKRRRSGLIRLRDDQ